LAEKEFKTFLQKQNDARADAIKLNQEQLIQSESQIDTLMQQNSQLLQDVAQLQVS
jgi:predicted translin family RNA/ssDNA-binding protein